MLISRGIINSIFCPLWQDAVVYLFIFHSSFPIPFLIFTGTGKSSLVCALCVGLGGSTRLLGRAEHVSSFVRRGTKIGEVTITLASDNPDRPHVVKRRINADNNASDWWLNGKEANLKDVTELVGKLNIQLDNLCQFLPQDKVVEFARMKPVELLAATEEAVGDSSLKESHSKLVDLRKELSHYQASEAQISAALEQLKADNARSERTVQQIRERERLEQEAQDLRLKVPWAEYAESKRAFQEEKEKFKTAEASLRTMKERQNTNDAPLKAKKKAADNATAAEKKAAEALRKADYKVVARGGKDRQTIIDELVAAIETKQGEVDGLEKKSQDRQRKITAAQTLIDRFEADMAGAEAAAHVTPAMIKRRKELESAMKDLAVQQTALDTEIATFSDDAKAAERAAQQPQLRLNQLGDSRMQRLRALDNRFHGIGKAFDWISKNKSRFRGPVLGPVGMDIECPNPLHANMLEMQISNIWLAYFVVMHQEDQDLLRQEVFNAVKYRPNVAVYHGDPDSPLQHKLGTSSDYARYGMTNTLDEVFQAPLLIKKALDDNFYITQAFVCSGNGNWQEFFKAQPRAMIVYTPDNKITHRTSRYNARAVSEMLASIRPARFLCNNTNGRGGAGAMDQASERQELQRQIQEAKERAEEAMNSRRALEPDLRAIRERMSGLQKELTDLNRITADAIAKVNQLKAKKAAKISELQRLEKSLDPLSRKPALEREIAGLFTKVVSAVDDLSSAYCKWATATAAHSAPELCTRELSDQVERMSAAARAQVAELERMQALVNQFKNGVNSMKTSMDRKHAEAKEATGWPLPEDLEAKFAAMPSDSAALRAAATAKADEAEGLMISDPGALDRYQKRCADIAENERQLEVVTRDRDFHAQQIAELKERWVSELRRITATINTNFSAAFPSVGCAGEVVLREAEDDDFSNYAIDVRVKFRENEELNTLDANRQSGGERSVSTILYLVALQEVASSPFRVVDEINQGMDPINERKVFKLLVNAATAPNTPQCFLLTPKLLPDLPFSKEVTVLQIMNGVHIKDVAQGFQRDNIFGNRTQMLTANA